MLICILGIEKAKFMIEAKTKIKSKQKQHQAKTEEELQTSFGKSTNPVIKALLAARREHLQKYGRYFTNAEVEKYLGR